jgi:hypothetical protein
VRFRCCVIAVLLFGLASCRWGGKASGPGTTRASGDTARDSGDTPPSEPGFESPEPAQLIPLRLDIEDGEELRLTFALPGAVELECHKLVTRIERGPGRIDVVILGLVALDPDRAEGMNCRMVKVPPPFKDQFSLPRSGRYQVAFHWGTHVDKYALAVEPEWLEFSPAGESAFTHGSGQGRFLRAGADWLWVTVRFSSPTAAANLGVKRDALIDALEALGARPFEPPAGRYLLSGNTAYVNESGVSYREEKVGVSDQRFFHWSGDWNTVKDLLVRYRKYGPSLFCGGDGMTVWVSQRSRYTSTYGYGAGKRLCPR